MADCTPEPKLTVCIVTYQRPEFVQRCLDSLSEERVDVSEIVVVDASLHPHRPTGLLRCDTYVHAPELAGWMTRSRNRALLHVTGDVVAFLDDDVVVHPGWAKNLRHTFKVTDAAAVVGRTLNGQPGEEVYHKPIGRLLPNGDLTEGFAASRPVRERVEHGIGANMSFRRSVLARLGGFRDDYPGTALREDTDIFLRIKRLGLPAYFDPDVTVDHLPAPHVRGARFDTRYKVYGRRNHMVLLARDGGALSPVLRRWVLRQLQAVCEAQGARARVQRAGVVAVGLIFGTIGVSRQASIRPLPPERTGPEADRLRRHLSGAEPLSGAPHRTNQ